MGFLNGLKVLWSDPELRNKAIAYTLGATAVTCAASYAVTKAITRKDREYLRQGRVVTIEGELYWEDPNGEIRPYFESRRAETSYREEYDTIVCDESPDDDILYIKGRPYVMDDCGSYVPVRMPSAPRRKPSKKYYR